MPVTAIVPLKALNAAKTRLADAVDAEGRREVVAAMLARVLTACRNCPRIGDVLLVVGDAAGAALGRELATDVLVVAQPGLAVAMAAADAVTRGAAATLVVAADLPLATGEDLTAVCDAAGAADPAVVVAPTTDGGTAALLRRPAAVVATAYGPQSAAAHMRLAAAAGVPAVSLHCPNLALDVDTPDHLRAAVAAGLGVGVGSRAT